MTNQEKPIPTVTLAPDGRRIAGPTVYPSDRPAARKLRPREAAALLAAAVLLR